MLIASSQNARKLLRDYLCARVTSACSRKIQSITDNGLRLTRFIIFKNERGVIANSTQSRHELPINAAKSIRMRFSPKTLLFPKTPPVHSSVIDGCAAKLVCQRVCRVHDI